MAGSCFILACSSSNGGSTESTSGGSGSFAGGPGAAPSNSHGTMSGSAGKGSRAGAPGASPADPEPGGGGAGAVEEMPPTNAPPIECNINGSCISDCREKAVTCAVASVGFACELRALTGAEAPTTCGERATVGMACCGGCGCVPVEVFFDGSHCWEGIPQCELPEFKDKFFEPHAPGSISDRPPIEDTGAAGMQSGSGGSLSVGGETSAGGTGGTGETEVGGGGLAMGGGAGSNSGGYSGSGTGGGAGIESGGSAGLAAGGGAGLDGAGSAGLENGGGAGFETGGSAGDAEAGMAGAISGAAASE